MKYLLMGIVIILAMSTLLCGCWDTLDMENLDIGLIAGYDTPPSGEAGQVAVTALLAAVVEKD